MKNILAVWRSIPTGLKVCLALLFLLVALTACERVYEQFCPRYIIAHSEVSQ